MGWYGFNWASTASTYTNSTTASAYALQFTVTDGVSTSRIYGGRWAGYSLRCAGDETEVYAIVARD